MAMRATSNCSLRLLSLIVSGGKTTFGALPFPLGIYLVIKQKFPKSVRLGFMLFDDAFN